MMRDLMLRFASLGDNCELGFVQKAHQANAMDLLRWAATPAGVLLRMLEDDFAHIGQTLKVTRHGTRIRSRMSIMASTGTTGPVPRR